MEETVATLGSLQLPGAWRVACIGRLTKECAVDRYPFINVYLGQVDDRRPGRMRGELQRAALPIGELPLIHLNKILVDGSTRNVATTSYPFERFGWMRLSSLPGDMTVFDRHAEHEGEPIIPTRERWTNLDPDRDGLFVGFRSGDDPYATVVPCTEIFRFFYATSSVMAASILMGDIVDCDRMMWDAENSSVDKGHAFLRLRRRMLDSDARSIARFAFDPYALKSALDVFYFNARQSPRGHERAIRALPPFQQAFDCALTHIPIVSGRRRRRLATRLTSCKFVPPFHALTWDRENDGRFDPDNRENREEMPRKPKLRAPHEPSEPRLGIDRPSGQFHPQRIALRDSLLRFPLLEAMPAVKAEQSGAHFKSSKSVAFTAAPALIGSVIRGTTSASLLASTIIAGREEKAQLPVAAPDRSAATAQLLPANKRIVELLQEVAQAGLAAVTFEQPFDTVCEIMDVPYCLFPQPRGSRRSSWLYVDSQQTMRRAVLTARLTTVDGSTRYLADIEHKLEGEMSMLVLWSADQRPLAPALLKEALEWCAELEGARVGHVRGDLLWGRRKHSATGSETTTAQRFIESIFMTTSISPTDEYRAHQILHRMHAAGAGMDMILG